MKEHEQYLGAHSPEVVLDLIHSLGAEYFFLVGYIPHTEGTMNLYLQHVSSDIPDIPHLQALVEAIQKSDRPLVGVSSRILNGERLRHMPMMDFSSSIIQSYGTDRVKEVMESLGQRSGLVLDSGRSYHFYGFTPMSHSEWLKMMEHAPDFNEIGPNYPRRQLKDGGNTLRISTNDYKPKMPQVIDIFKI